MKKIKNMQQLSERRQALYHQRLELEKSIRSNWSGIKQNVRSPFAASAHDSNRADSKRSKKSVREEIISGIAGVIFQKVLDRMQARRAARNKRNE